VWPLAWDPDGHTIILAALGLMIAAGGGIGGGGILVPLYMLVLHFRPKHAIALSNITILGGSIANTAINVGKRHPHLAKPLIDWDLIIVMEPLTIFGAVFGTLLSKVLPNIVLTSTLTIILAFMGDRTLRKGLNLWKKESARTRAAPTLSESLSAMELEQCSSKPNGADTGSSPNGGARRNTPPVPADGSSYIEFHCQDSEGESAHDDNGRSVVRRRSESREAEQTRWRKIAALTVCFLGTTVFTLLRGGGHYASPLGFDCGSQGYWFLVLGVCPWIACFAVYFRWVLVSEHDEKVANDYAFTEGEVHWDRWNTIKYPLICALSGLLAGLFGVGGGPRTGEKW